MKTALLTASLAFVSPASAMEKCCWQYDNARPAPVIKHHVSQPKKTKTTKPKRKKTYAKKATPKGTAVLAYSERAQDGKCYQPLTVVGSQWVGESGAYESAIKAMKERIRWDIGESAMDPAHWKDLKKRCSLSSVGEVVGQTFTRCELTATPCRPPVEPGSAPQ